MAYSLKPRGWFEGHMASFCASLKNLDNQAFSLCQQRETEGDLLVDLDVGVSRLNFKDPDQPKRVLEGAGDKAPSPQEVYQRYLTLVFQEERDRSKKYLKNLTKPPAFTSSQLETLHKNAKADVPFVFDDLDPKTKEDEKLFKSCLKKIQKVKKQLAKEKLKTGSMEYNKRLGTELFHFIVDPTKKGGLGVQFEGNATRADRSLAGIVTAKQATCVEFVFLYTALARLADLEVMPLEVFRNQKGYLEEHVRIALRLDPDDPKKTYFFDISDGLAGEREGEQWTEISYLDLWAYYYNDAYIGADNSKDEENFLKQALRFSPGQYMVLSNYGHWLLDQGGDANESLKLFLKAYNTNPQYPFILRGMARVYDLQAKAARQRAEELLKPRIPKK